MTKPIFCTKCESPYHYQSFCPLNRKPIKKQSDKEKEYQLWKEAVARPAVIDRDGNHCSCCYRPAKVGEKLDLDHDEGKGANPSRKRDITNLRLLCRFPCHRNKTDGKPCLH